MKKTLFLLAALMPCAAFAQSVPMGGYSSGPSYLSFFIFLLILIGLFFLCREILCWYWKVNKMVQNQEEIIRLLNVIASKMQEEKHKEADNKVQSE